MFLTTDDEQMWVYLCKLAPNLNAIHINHQETYDVQYTHTAVTPSDVKLTCLTELHVDFDEYNTDFVALRWLIDSCHSTLEDFQLTSYSSSLINGRLLEELLHPCRNLRKLSFFIQTDWGVHIDIAEQLCQFQTNWWLDDCRPPVHVQHTYEDAFIFTTIPCTYKPYSFQLPINPKMWLLNKGHVDSSLFYFTKIKDIQFHNNSEQPVTLDFLCSVNRILRSGIEDLEFDYWGFSSPETLFDQVSVYTLFIHIKKYPIFF